MEHENKLGMLVQDAIVIRAYSDLRRKTGDGLEGLPRHTISRNIRDIKQYCEDEGIEFRTLGNIALAIAFNMAEPYMVEAPEKSAHKMGSYEPIMTWGNK